MNSNSQSKEEAFELNHRVIVLAGDRAGKIAWVVEHEEIAPEVNYRIEYEDGSFAQKLHRELKSDEEKRA